MEISSHYYALLALCRTCGLNKETSYKIAYASQFVDDAKINCFTEDDETNNPFTIENIATCHSYFKMRTFNYQAMMFNTVAFHFPPGCEGDNFTQKLICKENSPIINKIINENLYNNPEVFGMLMHIYADTFAHQGFSGLLSKQNDIENLKDTNLLINQDGWLSAISYWFDHLKIFNKFKEEKDLDDFIPAYGHGQASHHPDIPYLEWSYEYSKDRCDNKDTHLITINNKERFKRAFENIENYIKLYIQEHKEFIDNNFDEKTKSNNLKKFYEILKSKETTKNKINSWQKFLTSNNYYDENKDNEILNYDETIWIKELIKDYDEKSELHKVRKVSGIKLVKGYENCSWLKYVVGVKEYKIRLTQLCKEEGLILNM